MRLAALWGWTCFVCALASVAPVASAAPKSVKLPILVHLAREGGRAVAERDFWERQIARANEIFAPYAVGFSLRGVVAASGPARMESRADRDQLGAQVQAGAINCFVVASLRDVDEPERMRRGVHWHSETHAPAHYVILSAIADPNVLAHELGHFLGNPRHSETSGNLMSYDWGDGLPFLAPPQVQRVERTIRGYLQRGELALTAARSAPAPAP